MAIFSSRIWANGTFMKLSALIALSIFGYQQAAQAQIYKSGNGCYEVRLAGSLVDVNECKQTSVRLRQVDCTTKANIKVDRAFATLSQCTADQARGQVKTATGTITFLAKRNLQSGMEYWGITSASGDGEPVAVAANTQKTNAVRKPGTKPTIVRRPGNPLTSNFRGPERLGLGLYADFARVFFSQDESKHAGTATDNLRQSSRNLRSSDILRDTFSLGFLNARAAIGEGAFDFVLDISAGDLARVWMSTPMGNGADSSIFISQAYATYQLSPRTKLKAGIFDSPVSIEDKRPGMNALYSSSLTQTYGVPHVLTGVGAQFDFWSILFEADVVNGWNKVSDDNSDVAVALTAKKSWGALSTNLGIFFSPNEGSSGGLPGQIGAGILDMKYLWSEKMNLYLTFGGGSYTPSKSLVDALIAATPTLTESDAAIQWYSAVATASRKISDRDVVSVSGELFETSGASYFQRSGWASSFLVNAGWKRRFSKSFSTHVELQADLPFGDELTGPKASTDFKILTAISWSGMWGDPPTAAPRAYPTPVVQEATTVTIPTAAPVDPIVAPTPAAPSAEPEVTPAAPQALPEVDQPAEAP